MKPVAMSKSWDDIYPIDHPLEFQIPKACNTNYGNSDGHATPARHWRSKSAPDEEVPSSSWDISPRAFQQFKEGWKRMRKSIDGKKKDTKDERRSALEQDVAHLRMTLENERAIRGVLEQALGRATSVMFPIQNNLPSKQTRELIKEIASLELEVAYLEQHLLSLYRKAFEQRLDVLKVKDEHQSSENQGGKAQQRTIFRVAHKHGAANCSYKNESSIFTEVNISGLDAHPESKSNQITNICGTPTKDQVLRLSYSQPITLTQSNPESSVKHSHGKMKNEVSSINSSKDDTSRNSFQSGNLTGTLSPLLGENNCESPNKLSEELVRCMAAIYCKLAEPPLPLLGGSISPPSSSSSASTFSTRELSSDGWSPICQTECDVSSSDSSQLMGATEGMAYNSMVEVPWICVDNDRLAYAARMLRSFRSLVQQLENVDPGQMKCEEKLAFWINIFNALMMHAYLAYGIPRNHIKRVSLLQKAAYKIGALSINAHTIEQSILGCRSHRPAQWLQTLLSPGLKLRGDERQAYALDTPEPLVCFALCCGGQSDPAVRVYTAKNIYQELDVAKQEFLQMSISVRKENKVLLPRILESFARESSFGTLGLLEWVCQNVSGKQESAIKKCIPTKQKCIEWVPYNFTFRYIFVRDLAQWFPPAAP